MIGAAGASRAGKHGNEAGDVDEPSKIAAEVVEECFVRLLTDHWPRNDGATDHGYSFAQHHGVIGAAKLVLRYAWKMRRSGRTVASDWVRFHNPCRKGGRLPQVHRYGAIRGSFPRLSRSAGRSRRVGRANRPLHHR